MTFMTNKEAQTELAKLPDDLIIGDSWSEGFLNSVDQDTYEDANEIKKPYIRLNFVDPEDDSAEEEIVDDGSDIGPETL